VSGPGSKTTFPTGSVSFEDTTNGNFLLGSAVLGTPTLTQSFFQVPSPGTTTGHGPTGVAVGDFNGDGKTDIAQINSADGTVSIFLGNGDGTFRLGQNYVGTSLAVFSIVVGDFNGDGKADIATVCNQTTSPQAASVCITLGNGDGTFQPQTPYSALGNSIFSELATADLNGDGRLDIVVTSSTGQSPFSRFAILLGNGDGTFANPMATSESGDIIGLAIGDFNRDGKQDLVISDGLNGIASGLDLYLGNGDGTFQSPLELFPNLTPTFGVVARDFNNDGILDLAYGQASPTQIVVALGNGDGTFTVSSSSNTGININNQVAGDFNQDGNLDIIATYSNGSSTGMLVLFGNGDGTFQSPQIISLVGNRPFGIATGDFNGDGTPDLAISNFNDNTDSIVLDEITATVSATLNNVSVPGCGIHSVDDVFPGSGNYSASTSGTVPLIGSSVPTALTLVATPSSSVPGQQVALTAVLTPPSVGSMTTNGEPILFSIGGSSIGSAILSSGVATTQTTSLPTGAYTIAANYPTDCNFLTSSATTSVSVAKTTPTITWANPAAITFGTALSGIQLNAMASVPGTLTYLPAAGVVLGAGPQTLTVNFVPTDTTNFNNASASVTLNVIKATPTITWANPTAITFGTALSGLQLNATASTAGNFVYSPVAGTVLGAGPQTLSVTFTPNDTADFNNASASVALIVNKATPTITWANPAAVTFGTALSGLQLNATASTAGNFVYSPVAGTVLGAGPQTLSVSFTPTDTADFTAASATVPLIVNKATPTITWANPAAITFGTALSGLQLNATASTAGNFVYSPVAGTVLGAGPQTLSVAFTPTDTADFNNAGASVALIVNKETPTITWANPAAITYGTALTGIQLDATASTAGNFVYSPVAGTVLGAGPQTLSVAFTPTDTADFNNQTATVTLVVNKATPTITWANPAAIPYGTALSGIQLDATGSVPGTFAYAAPAGTILSSGLHTITATLAPTDTTDFNTATASVTLNVTKVTPTISWPNPAAITYGTALSATQLDAAASVPGTFVYLPPAGTVLGAGTQTLSVTFTPTDAADYNPTMATATLIVNKATPIITWANPASITYGTALSGTQLNATASVPGSFIYSPAAGTILGAGTQTLSVSFTPTDAADYNPTMATATIAVTKAAAIGSITSSLDPSTFNLSVTLTFTYKGVSGLPLPTGSVTVVDGGNALVTLQLNAAGVATYTTSDLSVGSHSLVATYGGDANYQD
jgi:hypothetical protein